MHCEICHAKIPEERLEVFPNTRRCVRCSEVKRVEGLMDYGHKTAPQLVILPDNPEAKRRAYRVFRRDR